MKGVKKVFETSSVATHALRHIDLSIEQGEFVAITGASGSGKSTLLNIIGLLDVCNAGTYELDGMDVSTLSDDRMSELRNEKLGFIFQSFNLIPELSLYANVEVPLIYRGVSSDERKETVEKSLELVGLLGRKNHLPSQLSGGQQQRVAIARAIAGKPALILADEPTGNLDSTMAEEVIRLLNEINKMGTTILMVTHDDELAANTARQIQVMDGQINRDSNHEVSARALKA
jgi:putative ABC transport system ATP-binding protein